MEKVSELNYKCVACIKCFDKSGEFLKHLQTVHQSQLAHWCWQCGYCFEYPKQLVKHLKKQLCRKKQVKYKCPVPGCKNKALNGQELIKHLKNNHRGSNTFITCHACNKLFTVPSCYVLHVQNECKNDYDARCHDSDDLSSDDDNCNERSCPSEVVEKDKFKCAYCPYIAAENDAKLHCQEIHPDHQLRLKRLRGAESEDNAEREKDLDTISSRNIENVSIRPKSTHKNECLGSQAVKKESAKRELHYEKVADKQFIKEAGETVQIKSENKKCVDSVVDNSCNKACKKDKIRHDLDPVVKNNLNIDKETKVENCFEEKLSDKILQVNSSNNTNITMQSNSKDPLQSQQINYLPNLQSKNINCTKQSYILKCQYGCCQQKVATFQDMKGHKEKVHSKEVKINYQKFPDYTDHTNLYECFLCKTGPQELEFLETHWQNSHKQEGPLKVRNHCKSTEHMPSREMCCHCSPKLQNLNIKKDDDKMQPASLGKFTRTSSKGDFLKQSSLKSFFTNKRADSNNKVQHSSEANIKVSDQIIHSVIKNSGPETTICKMIQGVIVLSSSEEEAYSPVHSSSKNCSGIKCSIQCDKPEQLKKHKHYKKLCFSCKYCNRTFPTCFYLQNHHNWQHPKDILILF